MGWTCPRPLSKSRFNGHRIVGSSRAGSPEVWGEQTGGREAEMLIRGTRVDIMHMDQDVMGDEDTRV